ncbi:dihydrodipicolinate synthase family protein [bacterium]|nr:MAG: dihydrodipicolinate synthase family protein [bacterium]
MMTQAQACAALRGVFTIQVTPFDREGSLDRDALASAIERAVTHGVDGLLIGGTYGEFATMTAQERAELFRFVMDVVDRRLPVLLCSADSDVRVVRDLTALASDLGGIPMTTPPYVSEVTDEQVVGFFREIAALSSRGLVIYNAPGVAATLTASAIERLAEIDGIIGIKQGELSPATVDVLVGRLKGKIALLCASDLHMLGPLAAGFDGLTSTNSCALPELIMESARALLRGDAGRAGDLHRSWYAYRAFARRAGQPQTVKAAMAARGWEGGSVRPPLCGLSAEEYTKLTAIVRSVLADVPSAVRTKAS